MAEGKAEMPEREILRMAALLGEGDEGLGREELRRTLKSCGIDPARATARFHEAAQRLAEDVSHTERAVPLSLQQAIAETEPSVLSAQRESLEPDISRTFAEHWLDRFLAPFALPTHLEASRAYRRVGTLA